MRLTDLPKATPAVTFTLSSISRSQLEKGACSLHPRDPPLCQASLISLLPEAFSCKWGYKQGLCTSTQSPLSKFQSALAPHSWWVRTDTFSWMISPSKDFGWCHGHVNDCQPNCHSPPTTHPTAWLSGLVKNQWKAPLSGTPACSPAQALRLKPRLRLIVTVPWNFQKAHTRNLLQVNLFKHKKAYRYFICRTKWKAYQFHCGEQTLFTENSSSSPVAKHNQGSILSLNSSIHSNFKAQDDKPAFRYSLDKYKHHLFIQHVLSTNLL